MSLDTAIELDCEPRRVLGSTELIDHVVARDRLRVVEAVASHQGVAPEAVGIDLVTHAGEAPLDPAALRDQARSLERLSPHCTGCPVNLWSESFGCVLRLEYPIGPDVGPWLLTRLPDDLSVPPGTLLTQAIADFTIDGRRARQMREQGLLLGEPAVRRWSDSAISSDQVIELLVFVKLGVAAIRLLALLFGAARPVPPQSVMTVLQSGAGLEQGVYLEADDTPSLRSVKQLLIAILAAGQVGASVSRHL